MVPHDSLASASNLTNVWRCPGEEVELDFSTGIKVLEDVNSISSPKAAWEALASQDPDYTSVGTVRGQPAALIDPARDPAGTALGSVTLVDGGVWMVVVGNGKLFLADLERVANSLTSTG